MNLDLVISLVIHLLVEEHGLYSWRHPWESPRTHIGGLIAESAVARCPLTLQVWFKDYLYYNFSPCWSFLAPRLQKWISVMSVGVSFPSKNSMGEVGGCFEVGVDGCCCSGCDWSCCCWCSCWGWALPWASGWGRTADSRWTMSSMLWTKGCNLWASRLTACAKVLRTSWPRWGYIPFTAATMAATAIPEGGTCTNSGSVNKRK